MNARKRARDRAKKQIHIKRVKAQIKLLGNGTEQIVTSSRLILNDIGPSGLGLFLSQPLPVGVNIAITLEEPKRVYLKGRIIYCQEHSSNSHVLSKEAYSYRIGVQFQFESDAEKKAVKAFCEEIQRNHLYCASGDDSGEQAA